MQMTRITISTSTAMNFSISPAARFAVFYNGKKGRVLYPTYYSDKVKGKTLKESGVINEKDIAI